MKKWLFVHVVVLAICSYLLTACSGGGEEVANESGVVRSGVPADYAGKKNSKTGNAKAIKQGNEIFNVNCASCHGEGGKGDGPAAAALDPKPQNLSASVGSLGDDYLFWRISEGGLMEPFRSAMPSLKTILNEDQIWSVIAYLRTLAK